MGFVKDIASSSRANNASGTTAYTFAITAAPGAGNACILHLNSNVLPTSITDTKGNTWTKSASTSGGNAVPSQWITQQDVGTLTTSDSVTLHFGSNCFGLCVKIGEYSGLTASPLDRTATGIFATATTSRTAGTTAATSQANEIAIATYGLNGAETSFTPTTGWSTPTTAYVVNSTNNTTVEMEYKILSATGTVSPSGTGGATLQGAGVVCTYKLSSSGNIVPSTNISANSTVAGRVVAKHKISGAITATSTMGGTINKPGAPSVPSTYGAGQFGRAIYGGSGAPPPTGLSGIIRATSVVSGAISRGTSTGGIYTPPYTPPQPPPGTAPGTFGSFAQAVYDDLNADLIGNG